MEPTSIGLNAKNRQLRKSRIRPWIWWGLMVCGLGGLLTLTLVPAVLALVERWVLPQWAEVGEEEVSAWLQSAWQRVQVGDEAAAEAFFVQALASSMDPGGIAFERGLFEYQRGRYREAELWFARAAADGGSPPSRVVRAWYNRGICLLQRGGEAAVYRQAILCLRQALLSGELDGVWTAEARYHLELAKLLWDESRRREDPRHVNPQPPSLDEEPNSRPPSSDPVTSGTSPTDHAPSGTIGPIPPPPPVTPPTGAGETPPRPNAVPLAGAGQLEALRDTSTVQVLTPEDTRTYLLRTAERLKRDRQAMLRNLYGPERTDLRDW